MEVLHLSLLKKLSSSWTLVFPSLSVSILPFSSLSVSPLQLFPSLFLEFPSSLLNSHSSDTLTAVLFSRNIFLSVTPATMRAASPVLSLNIFRGTSQLEVSGISPGFRMSFPLNTQIQPLASLLNQVFVTMTRTKESVISKGFLKCYFFNSTSSRLSGQGCSLVDLTASSATCECSHMTSFGVFFDSGVDVISQSNYNVWYALGDLTLDSLKKNVGFFIILGWWGSLSLFGVICWIADSSKMRRKFLFYLALSLDC